MHTDGENYKNNDFTNDIEVNRKNINGSLNDDEFYNYNEYQNREENHVERPNNKHNKAFIFIIILAIILAVLIFLLVKSCDRNEKPNSNEKTPSIVLTMDSLELKIGNSQKIEYNVINSDELIPVTWLSSDKNVVTVTEDGTVKAIKKGTAVITASYFINDVPYEKTCSINVVENTQIPGKDNEDSQKPTLKYTFENGKNNEWTNKAVTIKITASDNSGKVSVKYALNCTKNCKYINLSSNSIKISEAGTNVVTIVASDDNNNSTEAVVTIKIDNSKPQCMLVIKDQITGVVSAETTDNDGSGISYYGFSSSYSGTNQTEKTLSVGTHTYYVKDKAGNTNTCTIKLAQKTQYRYKDCKECKRCQSAGCESYYSQWVNTGTHTNITKPTCQSPANGRDLRNCNVISEINGGEGGCRYKCEKWEYRNTSCYTNKASCSACGCKTYGNFSAWSDNAVSASSSRAVETRKVYIKG